MKNISKLFLLIFILISVTSCSQNQSTTVAQNKETKKTKQVKVPYRAPEIKKKELNKAILWHKESAKQGNAEMENSFGNLLQAIIGNTKINKESIQSFKNAAKLGHAGAQNSLAMHYYLGNGINKNINKALYWYEEAGKNGNVNAIQNLGRIYAKGQVVKTDHIKAYKWLDLARYYTFYSNNKRLKKSILFEIDELAKTMNTQQINNAKQMAQDWLNNLQKSNRFNA